MVLRIVLKAAFLTPTCLLRIPAPLGWIGSGLREAPESPVRHVALVAAVDRSVVGSEGKGRTLVDAGARMSRRYPRNSSAVH